MPSFQKPNSAGPVQNRFWLTFNDSISYYVPPEWQDELYSYIVLGLAPSRFFRALYANDLMAAVCSSHVMNTWGAIVKFEKWLQHSAPKQCYGSEENVQNWLAMSPEQRTQICINVNLLATDEEILWEVLNTVIDNANEMA